MGQIDILGDKENNEDIFKIDENIPSPLDTLLTLEEYHRILNSFNDKLKIPLYKIGFSFLGLMFLISCILPLTFGTSKTIAILIILFSTLGSLGAVTAIILNSRRYKQLNNIAEFYTNQFSEKGLIFTYSVNKDENVPQITCVFSNSFNPILSSSIDISDEGSFL